ncbi:MAG: nicotinamide mononucleotide transporter, partial [Blautia massiliensis (ex Durand et al. 2017)]
RSPLFAVAYAANDVVLIVLWSLATMQDPSYLSVVVCFVMFFVNDIYGFYNWSRMRRRQAASA